MAVPAPGADRTSSDPPTSVTRSRMPMSPKPSGGPRRRSRPRRRARRSSTSSVALDDGDLDAPRARVLGDVRQRLLHEAVDRDLDLGAWRSARVRPRRRGRPRAWISRPVRRSARSTSASSAGPAPSSSSDGRAHVGDQRCAAVDRRRRARSIASSTARCSASRSPLRRAVGQREPQRRELLQASHRAARAPSAGARARRPRRCAAAPASATFCAVATAVAAARGEGLHAAARPRR